MVAVVNPEAVVVDKEKILLKMKLHGLTPVVSSPRFGGAEISPKQILRLHPRFDNRGFLRRRIKTNVQNPDFWEKLLKNIYHFCKEAIRSFRPCC